MDTIVICLHHCHYNNSCNILGAVCEVLNPREHSCGSAQGGSMRLIHVITEFTFVLVNTPQGILEISSGLLGRHNIYNIVAAVAVGIAVGAPLEGIVRGIEEVDSVPERCELIDEEQAFGVIVDYAHTPDALSRLLDTVRELSPRRIITGLQLLWSVLLCSVCTLKHFSSAWFLYTWRSCVLWVMRPRQETSVTAWRLVQMAGNLYGREPLAASQTPTVRCETATMALLFSVTWRCFSLAGDRKELKLQVTGRSNKSR